MVTFHRALQKRAQRDANFFFHYVTAREMYNLARAAEMHWDSTVDRARDFEVCRIQKPSPTPVYREATCL
jgi:hypothetical protein